MILWKLMAHPYFIQLLFFKEEILTENTKKIEAYKKKKNRNIYFSDVFVCFNREWKQLLFLWRKIDTNNFCKILNKIQTI